MTAQTFDPVASEAHRQADITWNGTAWSQRESLRHRLPTEAVWAEFFRRFPRASVEEQIAFERAYGTRILGRVNVGTPD